MISRRFAVPLLVALAVALLPTVQHGYVGRTPAVDKITDASLPVAVDGVTGTPKVRTGGWMTSTYGADSWAERTYDTPGPGEVSLFVARGFDLKKLYHHPELGVLRGRSFDALRSAVVDGRPVYVLENATDGESAVYALVYEGDWIGNPYVLQASSALTSLWTGPRPLTLVFVYGAVLNDGQPTRFATEVLRHSALRLSSPPGRS